MSLSTVSTSLYITQTCLIFFMKISYSHTHDFTSLVDVRTLSELPLEKLLKVRDTFELSTNDLKAFNEPIEARYNPRAPIALPLQATKKNATPIRRGEHHDDHFVSKKGKSSLFASSVTVLAFLAFGGYLLCLLLHTIRLKQDEVNATTTTTQALLAALAQKRPLQRIRKRTTSRPGHRHKRDSFEHQRMLISENPEDMYRVLVMVSESYKNFHTVDYKYHNQTVPKSYF